MAERVALWWWPRPLLFGVIRIAESVRPIDLPCRRPFRFDESTARLTMNRRPAFSTDQAAVVTCAVIYVIPAAGPFAIVRRFPDRSLGSEPDLIGLDVSWLVPVTRCTKTTA